MKKLILSLVALSVLTAPIVAVTVSPAKAEETVIIKKKGHHDHGRWHHRHHRDNDRY